MGTVTKEDLAGKVAEEENKGLKPKLAKTMEQAEWGLLTLIGLAAATQFVGIDAWHLLVFFLILNKKSLLNISVKQAHPAKKN